MGPLCVAPLSTGAYCSSRPCRVNREVDVFGEEEDEEEEVGKQSKEAEESEPESSRATQSKGKGKQPRRASRSREPSDTPSKASSVALYDKGNSRRKSASRSLA